MSELFLDSLRRNWNRVTHDGAAEGSAAFRSLIQGRGVGGCGSGGQVGHSGSIETGIPKYSLPAGTEHFPLSHLFYLCLFLFCEDDRMRVWYSLPEMRD